MRPKLLTALAVLAVIAALGYGGHAWYYAAAHVWTDDAYVDGTISPVSAKVAGHVVKVAVEDHQTVAKGDLLLRIDPGDYEARRD
jgi:membrane fusion protein, multidrug efflux system